MRAWARPDIRWVVGASIAALALAGGALATVAVEGLALSAIGPFGNDDEVASFSIAAQRREAAELLGCAAFTTTALLALALTLGVRSPTWVRPRTVLACAALGWLDCAACLSLHALLAGSLTGALGMVVLGLLFGLAFALPLGLLYGVVSQFATARLRCLIDQPTLLSRVEAVSTVAATVLAASLPATLIAADRTEPLVRWQAPAALALAALLVLLAALYRAHWIRTLARDPARAGLTRLSLDELGVAASSLLPLHPGIAPTATHALARVLPPRGDGAYREAAARIAIALVD